MMFGKKERADVASHSAEGRWYEDEGPAQSGRGGAVVFSAVVFAVTFCAAVALCYLVIEQVGVFSILAALAAGYLASSWIHIVMDWERVCITRFGVFRRVAGPGLVFTIPVVDQIALRIDQRVRATPFGAEKTLTSDLVPVDVDAILLWMVWDAKKACLEVEDYERTVSFVAQTSMREAIGRASIARVALQRNQIDKELEEIINKEVESWGIAIIAVKVRDIVIPQSLQDAMSLQAQSERKKEARLTLADAELEISEMLADAAKTYEGSDVAMKLRTLHLLNETVEQSNGSVVTVPSTFSDGFTETAARRLFGEPAAN